MQARNEMTKSTAKPEITMERVFNAPRELVFKAWTDPKHVDQWMGPRGFTTTTKSMEFKVGGRWIYMMNHDKHGEFSNRVIYREIVKNEKIAYTHSADIDNDPDAFETVVTFEAQGAKTKVTMRSV